MQLKMNLLWAGLLVSIFGASSQAALIYDEAVNGQFSRVNTAPTNLGTLVLGNSSIAGNITGTNVEYFRFTIAPGQRLDAIYVPAYSGGDQLAFFAIDEATTFPFTRAQMNSTNPYPDENQFIGGSTFGPGNNVVGNNTDILSSNTSYGIGGRNIGKQAVSSQFGPFNRYDWLDSGTYTVYMQQTGPLTNYTLDFGVVAVPEPSAATLSILSVCALASRRRSRPIS